VCVCACACVCVWWVCYNGRTIWSSCFYFITKFTKCLVVGARCYRPMPDTTTHLWFNVVLNVHQDALVCTACSTVVWTHLGHQVEHDSQAQRIQCFSLEQLDVFRTLMMASECAWHWMHAIMHAIVVYGTEDTLRFVIVVYQFFNAMS